MKMNELVIAKNIKVTVESSTKIASIVRLNERLYRASKQTLVSCV